VDLNGPWRFAIDPVACGEQSGWHQPAGSIQIWAEVVVPHCWNVDPRFPFTGTAWYRRTFSLPPGSARRHARLNFGGVFYRAKVWLNGQPVGEHEGGYTPFQFDVTDVIHGSGENLLAVKVDNSWDTTTLPGARIGKLPQEQVYPWFEYGGIVRPVSLVLTDPVHVVNQRMVTTPHLQNGTATIEMTVQVANATDQPATIRIGLALTLPSKHEAGVSWQHDPDLTASAVVPPRTVCPVATRVRLSREQVSLWDPDHPDLYTLRTRLWKGSAEEPAADEAEPVSFGIRRIEARDGRLLLNGVPIRMGGGNRHADHPEYGSLDPLDVIDTDLGQMKRANMELSRISHYPVSPLLLDWADQHGLLIIEEGVNWQLTEAQLESAEIRSKFQAQMREMIERDWNHPCVIGWSVGNEYPSETPAGLRWTKDMVEWVRGIDSSRLLTFASDRAGLPKIVRPEDEASCHVDLVSVNLYRDYAERLDRIHALWPDKPVMVSEFAAAGHVNLSDTEYVSYFRQMMNVFRARPYVVAASVWTYNDYRSRYPGTASDGYRHYGVVNAQRELKPAYELLSAEFAPETIEAGSARLNRATGSVLISCEVAARKDFPAYPLRDYQLCCRVLDSAGTTLGTRTVPLPTLRPGDRHRANTDITLSASKIPLRVRLEVMRPTGFVTATTDVVIAP
jgi:beta-glucuronidase